LKTKVLVVDLDGTLFKVNTFHYFLKFYSFSCLKTFNLLDLAKIISILISRLLRLASHSKMKYEILNLASKMPNSFYEKFVDSILSHKRHITELNKDYDFRILATAAPRGYAEIISRNENFDACIATNSPNSSFNEWFENSRDVKKENVMNLLSKKEIYKIDTLITDHIDDLPLMQVSQTVKIVNPGKNLIFELNQYQISYEVIT